MKGDDGVGRKEGRKERGGNVELPSLSIHPSISSFFPLVSFFPLSLYRYSIVGTFNVTVNFHCRGEGMNEEACVRGIKIR